MTVKVRVTEAEAEAWREAAHEARVSVSELIRRSVAAALERQAAPEPPASTPDPLAELLAEYGA